MKKVLAMTAGLAFAAGAMANLPSTVSGLGGAIPDAGGGSFTSSVSLAGGAVSILGVSFNGLSHTWAGDLVMELTGPGAGNTFAFHYRPGWTGAGFGNSADYVASNSYGFFDGGTPFGSPSGVIPTGNYAPVAGSGAPAQSITSFGGMTGAAGTWTLTITDNAGGDTGSLNGWTLHYKAIPTPGAAALLGLAGVAGLRRRR